MSTGHTQGRLIVKGGYSLYADDGKTPVADTCLTNSIPDKDEANARRLGACWNACNGLPTSDLEHSALPEVIVNLMEAKVERDELLEALKGLVKLGLTGEPVIFTAEYDRSRAAIAKAEGGEA